MGGGIRHRNLPFTTPLIQTASCLPPTSPACESLHICPTPHALPAQLHPPRAPGICAVFSHCVSPQVPATFSQHPGALVSRSQWANGVHTGARMFYDLHFHSVGMPVFDAAGSLAADRCLFRTDFSGAPDRFRLGACSEARFACLHATLPPQRMHATWSYQPISLSFHNG